MMTAILVEKLKKNNKKYIFNVYVFLFVDSAAAKMWLCIHAHITPTQKLVKVDNLGKKTVQKCTIKDSQESFLHVSNNIQQMEEYLLFRKSKAECIQPFVIAIGDEKLNSFENFYLYLDGEKLIFNNILRAVDICFKAFYLFNLEYPVASYNFWTFIDSCFYKTNKVNSKSVKIATMLEEMK